MYLQNKDSVYDINWNEKVKYGDIYLQNEIEHSKYNFDLSDSDMLFELFEKYENEANNLIKENLIFPSYDYVLKCSHTFNLLDARGVISVTERTTYIKRINQLARAVAKNYLSYRDEINYPLLMR
jgi:glycyl-tRNA synthetase alpha chain